MKQENTFGRCYNLIRRFFIFLFVVFFMFLFLLIRYKGWLLHLKKISLGLLSIISFCLVKKQFLSWLRFLLGFFFSRAKFHILVYILINYEIQIDIGFIFWNDNPNSIALYQLLNQNNFFHLDKEECYKKGSERDLFRYHCHTVYNIIITKCSTFTTNAFLPVFCVLGDRRPLTYLMAGIMQS